MTRRLVPLLAIVLVAAACAVSPDAPPPAGAATARGVSAERIKVGGLLLKTSPSGYTLADTELGAKARFQRANAEGGVHGRTIEYIGSEDDGGDPAKDLAAARKLVQQDEVFAVVPANSPYLGGADFLVQNRVPFFGWAVTPQMCGNNYGYGFSGCLVPRDGTQTQTWWGRQVAAQLGGAAGKSAWVQGSDNDASRFGVHTLELSFKAAGFSIAGTAATMPSRGVPTDWSPYVNAIMKGAPNVVVSVMTTPFNIGLFGALKKAGFRGLFTDAVDYDPKLLTQPAVRAALQGGMTATQFEPFESDLPQVAQMKADLRKAAGRDDLAFTNPMAIGYWSADLFLAIAEKAGKKLTVETFTAAANDGFEYRNPAVGTLAFPKAHRDPAGCGALVRLDGGAYEVVAPLRCFPTAPFE
jgi:ABC-type branched-subunit amino acid transport system substrate-binding protein